VRKISFFLMLIAVSAVFALGPARAEEIRISCIIPETPGVNMPLVSENSYQLTRQAKKEVSTALQKESTETRLIAGQPQACIVQTVYIK
jgi:hypothetical protein